MIGDTPAVEMISKVLEERACLPEADVLALYRTRDMLIMDDIGRRGDDGA